ncbi:MAG TPA: L,D-transpeptidase [Polyangia bacterium]|nr:L,D-transpeptidase [Polyangia bacterium]
MRSLRLVACFSALVVLACARPPVPGPARDAAPPDVKARLASSPIPPVRQQPMPWDEGGELAEGETIALRPEGGGRMPIAWARDKGLLDVDLSRLWAPFIFSESDKPDGEVKPNRYRRAFTDLASDFATPAEIFLSSPEANYAVLMAAGLPGTDDAAASAQGRRILNEARRAMHLRSEPNFLEVYGIPPSLLVLLKRIDEDRERTCYANLDLAGLAGFDGTVTFQSREQAHHEYHEATGDAAWVDKQIAKAKEAAGAPARDRDEWLKVIAAEDAKAATRIERARRGQVRLRAIRAAQARLVCEGLLAKHVEGQFDLATNEALAAWERKNDIFGWGFLGGETLAALQRSPLDLHFDTFRRILMEHVADAAGIIEDGSVSGGRRPATYKDAAGVELPVPNLIADYTDALMAALGIHTAEDKLKVMETLRSQGSKWLHVAFPPPKLPPYYSNKMDLSVEIDRGDVWYDFPYDENGKPIAQPRVNFPSLTLYVNWNKQKIPLCRWRTTIGSWRSEMRPDGKVYFKYKNSDVGPRVWKDVVAGPVWIPPEATPAKDLLTRKTWDRDLGAEAVVNTDVMGPGYQSAYGLVMAIHHWKRGKSFFDNQIRTHGSVDYTSIARRFSHGCHRLVNSRAVRLFDFILRHRAFHRVGNVPIVLRRHFDYEARTYHYALGTRGYYYELDPPLPVVVTTGRIMGKLKKPIEAYLPKPGVDYRPPEESGESTPDVGP